MNHKTVSIDIGDSSVDYIVIDCEDGSQESFLVDVDSARYQRFLEETSQEIPAPKKASKK